MTKSEENAKRLTENAKAEMAKPVTVIPADIARGAEGKPTVHSRRSLEQQRGHTKPRQEPEVQVAKTVKAGKASKAKSSKGNVAVSKIVANRKVGTRLSLKQNKEVRGLLTTAAQAVGGTRLQPVGFDSYTAFLAGVPLDANGDAEVVFIPVKGNEPIKGKNVKLTIRGGKVTKVK
jgi:hypothetical protein